MDPADICAAYDAAAAAYVEKFARELEHKPFDRLFLDGLVARVKGPVLEVGGGPGHVAAYLHARGVEIQGSDLSPRMVEHARVLHPSIPFRVEDMLRLSDADASLGGVVAFYAVVNLDLSQVDVALQEARRVLRPGGVLALAFHVGNGPVQETDFLGSGADLEFRHLDPGDMKVRLKRARFRVEESTVRPPYAEEHPTKRAYMIASAA